MKITYISLSLQSLAGSNCELLYSIDDKKNIPEYIVIPEDTKEYISRLFNSLVIKGLLLAVSTKNANTTTNTMSA